MAFSRDTAVGVSEDMVRPAVGVERADGGFAGLVDGFVAGPAIGLVDGLGQDLGVSLGQGPTGAEAASG